MLSLVPTGLRCLVVDHEPTTMDQLVMLRAEPSVAHVCTACDAAGALRVLQDAEVDVVFIEARMPGLDGIELASVLRRFSAPPVLVFVTRCPERAADAFRLGALAYLRKPPRPDRLAESLRRASAVRRDSGARPAPPPEAEPVPVRVELSAADGTATNGTAATGDTARPLCASTVRWAQARGDYVRLHTADGSHLIRARLATLADDWRHVGLVRIHRSYLVSLRHVAEVRRAGSGRLTVLVDGHRLPVSRRFVPVLRGQLDLERWA